MVVTGRIPDRAGFDSPHGAVVAVRAYDGGMWRTSPRVVVGEKALTPTQAAEYARVLENAVDWLVDVGATTRHHQPRCQSWDTLSQCQRERHDGDDHDYAPGIDRDPWAEAVDASRGTD